MQFCATNGRGSPRNRLSFFAAAMAAAGSSSAPAATWVPLDVKIHWFSFLSAKDLANCGRVCRSWPRAARAAGQDEAAAPHPERERTR